MYIVEEGQRPPLGQADALLGRAGGVCGESLNSRSSV